jgi:serine/threonine-protein kinase SRPK3
LECWRNGQCGSLRLIWPFFTTLIINIQLSDLLGKGNLFVTKGGHEQNNANVYHLAHMISLLGPPPAEFLARTATDRVWTWFDRNGKLFIHSKGLLKPNPKSGGWKGKAEIPKITLRDTVNQWNVENPEALLAFMQKMLRWKPEERCPPKALLDDSWLNAP